MGYIKIKKKHYQNRSLMEEYNEFMQKQALKSLFWAKAHASIFALPPP